MPEASRRLRILTWHVHGNYLWYLTQVPHDFYLVTDRERSTHHTGRSGTLPWGDNVHEAPMEMIRDMEFDIILYQSRTEYERDQTAMFSAAQQRLPMVYLEHDPPLEGATEQRHWADDEKVTLVHVTGFNALMWDSRDCRVEVIDHGVKLLASARFTGLRDEGIVVANNIATRGRRLGPDVFETLRHQVPLTLVGMGSTELGGHGEVPNAQLPGFVADYRYFLNPIRYTSLGLSVIEAMMVGLPVLGLATTEMPTVIANGVNGWLETRPERLVPVARELMNDVGLARRWGEAARRTAEERFGIDRFVADWLRVFARAAGVHP
jgi:glycosyltransferase involved in cell wall biosynthesis